MNIVFLGAPASGKGTQAKLISERFGLFHLDVGDILRKAAEDDKKIDKIINVQGKLLPEKATFKLIAERLEEINALKKGVVFDGYPRTVYQYQLLVDWLRKRGSKIDRIFFLDVSEDTLIKRISARRVCSKCGKVFNLITNPPKQKGVCDCGGNLFQRRDDTPEMIKKRLAVYYAKTKPLINLLSKKKNFLKLDGEKPIEVIFKLLKSDLKKFEKKTYDKA